MNKEKIVMLGLSAPVMVVESPEAFALAGQVGGLRPVVSTASNVLRGFGKRRGLVTDSALGALKQLNTQSLMSKIRILTS